jgi:hypothetical protein
MSTGTTKTQGLMAGAARLGACAIRSMRAGIAAPSSTRTWHPQYAIKQVNVAFATDLTQRPSERSP